MDSNNLHNISPVDGRYGNITAPLSDYFSEYALIKARVFVETEYFIALSQVGIAQFPPTGKEDLLRDIYINFTEEDALKVKEYESITNHDVKAVEYLVKDKIDQLGLSKYREFVHFGLTSQDINNTAIPWLLKNALEKLIIPSYSSLIEKLTELSKKWSLVPMLGRTHGQAASPTTVGKELFVFAYRLQQQLRTLHKIEYSAKFGGATGNLNAHVLAFPDIDWISFADNFIKDQFGLKRSLFTTQIDNYDGLAEIFHCIMRLNTILSDLAKDMWTYIMMEYFTQQVNEKETGSSAMPHKVNPIDFENAEGNLGLANALLTHLAEKLPISRLQRDLSDSTVLRNVGVPLSHTLISCKSLLKGLNKIIINDEKLITDLENHWEVITEGIQNILRREGFDEPYEKLKEFSRGNPGIGRQMMRDFISGLNVPEEIKKELMNITPLNYTGTASHMDKYINSLPE